MVSKYYHLEVPSLMVALGSGKGGASISSILEDSCRSGWSNLPGDDFDICGHTGFWLNYENSSECLLVNVETKTMKCR